MDPDDEHDTNWRDASNAGLFVLFLLLVLGVAVLALVKLWTA
jgi:hypothetical protein